MLHAVACMFLMNLYHSSHLIKFTGFEVNDPIVEGAFSPEFFAKQTTWECGPMFNIIQFVLAVIVFIEITLEKDYDTPVDHHQEQ